MTANQFKRVMPLGVCLAGFGLLSCVDTTSSMFIEGVLPLVGGTGATACQLRVLPSGPFQVSSIFDLGAGQNAPAEHAFQLPMQVVTNLPSTVGTTATANTTTGYPQSYGSPDSNIITLESVTIDWADSSGEPLMVGALDESGNPTGKEEELGTLEFPATGVVYNRTATALSSQAPAVLTILDRDAVVAILNGPINEAIENLNASSGNRIGVVRLFATIRVTGKTIAGAVVRSPEFVYPVDVCLGCLAPSPANCQPGKWLPHDTYTGCFQNQDKPTACCAPADTDAESCEDL